MSAREQLDEIKFGLRDSVNTYKSLKLKKIGKQMGLHWINDLKTKSTLALPKGSKMSDLIKRVKASRGQFNMASKISDGLQVLESPGMKKDKKKLKQIERHLKKHPMRQVYSARDKLHEIIQLADDPRPRNRLGMFTGEQEGVPDPNAIDVTYKQGMGTPAKAGIAAGAGLAGGSALRSLMTKLKRTPRI
jgi:hypothetical protein